MSTGTDPTRTVRLRPLTYLPEGDGVVVGCRETDSYAVLPPDGAALLQLLSQVSPQEAAEWYAEHYGEPVDVDDFLATVAELGFVADGHAARPAEGLRGQRLGRLLFSPVSAVGAAALVVVAVLVVARDNALLPRTDHVFFSDYLLLIELTVAFGQIPLILVHELFHLLAARRVGVPARIRVGQRMYFVVFETVMDGLVAVPRRQRYLPMLAGMLADLLLVCLLTVLAALSGGSGPVAGVCLALAFSTLIRFALEFLLFLRTDVYYLICTLTGTIDLHTTSNQIIANLWWRLLRREDRIHDPARWHPRDVRAARWYTPVHVLGYGLATVLLLIVLLPISWRFVTTAAGQLVDPHLTSPLFWDSLALLLLTTSQPAVAGLIWLRDRAARHRPIRPNPVRTP